MNTTHEVVSAFLDDQPFEPEELAEALDDPAGRTLLIDLIVLRRIVQPTDAVPTIRMASPVRRSPWRALAAARGADSGARRRIYRRRTARRPGRCPKRHRRPGWSRRFHSFRLEAFDESVVRTPGSAAGRRRRSRPHRRTATSQLWIAGSARRGRPRKARRWFRGVSGKLTVGKSSIGIFSMRDCGYFTAATSRRTRLKIMRPLAGEWRSRRLKIVDHAVTFRLRWIRAMDQSNGLSPASEDVRGDAAARRIAAAGQRARPARVEDVRQPAVRNEGGVASRRWRISRTSIDG